VDSAILDLAPGHITFVAPDRMQFDDSSDVVAAITGSLPVDLTSRLESGESLDTQAISVGDTMRVALVGDDGLSVTALSPDWQAVGTTTSTEWDWTVRAVASGDHQLHLSVTVKLTNRDDGADLGERQVRVLDRTVNVEVTPGEVLTGVVRGDGQGALNAFAGQIGIALAALVTAAVTSLWAARHRSRRAVAETRTVSPDRNWWWNGREWVSTLSDDGLWRWNGTTWLPAAPEPPASTGDADDGAGRPD